MANEFDFTWFAFDATLLIISLIYLIFWVKSLLIMKRHPLFLILGICLPPLPQMAFYWHNHATLKPKQKRQFKSLFLASGIWFALFLTFFIIVIHQVSSQV